MILQFRRRTATPESKQGEGAAARLERVNEAQHLRSAPPSCGAHLVEGGVWIGCCDQTPDHPGVPLPSPTGTVTGFKGWHAITGDGGIPIFWTDQPAPREAQG